MKKDKKGITKPLERVGQRVALTNFDMYTHTGYASFALDLFHVWG